MLSIFGTVIPATFTVAASSAGTLDVSTTRFTSTAIVQVHLVDPDLNLNATAYDTATVSYTVTSYNGSTYGPIAMTLNESLPNSGEFYGYFSNASSTVTAASPPYAASGANYTLTYKRVGLSSGDTITFSYSDQAPVQTVTQTVTYKAYVATASDITFDRSSLQYPMNGYIRISVKDNDYNLDPTAVDNVNLTWSITDGVNATATFTGNLWLNETGANTNVFRMNDTTSYKTDRANFADYLIDLTGVSSGDPIKVSYLNETTPPFQYIYLMTFTRSVSVTSPFTSNGDIAITVNDPNVVQKSWSTTNDLTVVKGTFFNATTDSGTDSEWIAADLAETSAGSGIFTYTLPVVWGVVARNDSALELNVNDSKATFQYYFNGTMMSNGTATLSTTPATIAADKSQYKTTDTAKLTLIAPDINDDPTVISFATVNITAGAFITSIGYNYSTQIVGNLSITDNNLAAKNILATLLTFVETGVNTGIFAANLDLSNIQNHAGGALANGDTIKVSYYDAINDATSSVTFTIGVTAATVSLDRSTYPVPAPAIGAIKFKVTVTDPAANVGSSTIDTANNFWWAVYASNGTGPGLNNYQFNITNQPLTETGPNTGIFTKTITVAVVAATQTNVTNGWIKVWYTDPSTATNITATGQLTVSDGSLVVNTTSVIPGDVIQVTLTDPDLNTYSGTAETWATAPNAVTFDYTNPDGNAVTTGVVLSVTETDVNTGIFTGTVTIDTAGFVANTSIAVKPGSTITFKYNDWTPSSVTSSLPNFPTTPTTYTKTVTVLSHTGTISLDKSQYGLGAIMTITVVDPDLNYDVTAKETVPAANQTLILRISGAADTYLALTEGSVNNATFTNTTYQWAVDPTTLGKTFQVYYKDAVDASGNTVYAIATGTLMSWDATVSFDKAYYSVGDVVTVIVYNPDNNTNPTVAENIVATVSSDHDPVGQTITLTETGVNTGNFTGTIQISSTIASGKVYAQTGDTLTATFTDKLPADYATTLLSKTFTGTAIVGIPVSRPVPASAQAFVDPNTGATVTSGTVGTTIGLQATVQNVDTVNKTFTAIFKVKDSAGVTISISWITGTLVAGQSLTPGVSWTPSVAGDYTIEVLVVKTLAEPTAYSDKLTSTLTVS